MSRGLAEEKLLGRGKLHPALHVDDRGVVVGVITEVGDYTLITSDGDVLAPDDVKPLLRFPPRSYGDLAGRWPVADLTDWILTRSAPTFAEVAALLVYALDQAFEFSRRELRSLFAVWIMTTYFYRFFLTFPRLALSGERESGKSKLLALIQATGWNALLMLNPTPAVLFRLVTEFRPTLALDEMEGLSQEDARDILAILNSGYKLGGSVPRCEGDRIRRVELYETYAPAALAAIRTLNAVTEHRAIPVTLQRGVDVHKINTEIDPADPLFARIRSGCYRLLVTRWREVYEAQAAAAAMPLPRWLNGRARELWRPLLAIAALTDAGNGLTVTGDLIALAQDHVDERSGASDEAEALLGELAGRVAGSESLIVRPGDLRETLRDRLGWQKPPSAHAVGSWLRRLGFPRGRKDRMGARYEVTRTRLQEVASRYAPATLEEPPP
jgi:hypothetical protein